ncbi:MAG: Sensor protein FixL [Pseudomonadota bacterium]|jgi:signal transduction histidine kinase
METVFDVRTGFLLLGILASASAAGGYATLRASLHRGNLLWLASGLSFGAGGVLLALRSSIPDILSFELAHACLVAGLMGQALAVRQEGRPRLRQGRRALWVGLGVPMLSVAVFASVRRVDVVYGIVYFALAVGLSAGCVLVAAIRLWRAGGHRGAAIIALTFGVLTAAMAGRIVGVLDGVSDEPAFAPGLNQFFMLAAAFFTLVLGQVGYLGMQFERIAKGRAATERQAAVLAERARQTQLREEALRDLVEGRNQLIQRLARHESASDLARFAMDLPHQLSQPLCASKLNLEQVLDRLAADHTDPEVVQALKAVDASNDQVQQLLQQLRILLAHRDASDHREVELGALMTQTAPILQGSFRDQGVVLDVLPSPEPVWVHASPTQMQQLLLILCVNALTLLRSVTHDAAHPARVGVALAVQGNEAHLTVEDSGTGRLRQDVPSERIDVGLAIATRIAQAHRGELAAVDGVRPGATAFRLSLPRLPMPLPR